MTGIPVSARNLGVSGYTTRQVHGLVRVALSYRPQYVVVTAGTNDILSMKLVNGGITAASIENAAQEYAQMLDDSICGCASPVATLVPYTADSSLNELITAQNSKISAIAAARGLRSIDLNIRIAPKQRLLGEYSQVGVHLSDPAYDIWAQEILRVTGSQQRTGHTRKCASES